MTRMMKAAVVHAFGEPLRIEEVVVPTPGTGQIVVNINRIVDDLGQGKVDGRIVPGFD